MTKTVQTSKKALHVGVVREGRFIEDRWFLGQQPITVGTAAKNTFAFPLSTLAATQPLFTHNKQGQLLLHFDENARGKITINNRDHELADTRKEGLAVPNAGFFEIPLTESMRGRVTLGEVSFVFNFAPAPPKPPTPKLPKEIRGTIWNITDHTFMSVLFISLAIHTCAVGAISRRDLPPEDTAMDVMEDRFAKLLIPEKPPEEEKPKEEEKVEDAPAEDKKEEKKEAKKEPPKDSAEHKAEVQKAVASKGLVHILGAVGTSGGALANVLAAGGGFTDDIGAALAGAGGVAIATEAGGGSRRGEGAAQAATLGGISTGGGGNVKMREKQDVAVHGSVSSDGEADVDSSTVDKDALGRFIKIRLRSVQGCYEAQLKRSPTLRGKLVIRFTIGTNGQVTEVNVDSDSMGSDEVASCVMRLIKTWHFPFKPDSDTTVSFPFLFAPAG